MMFRSMHETSKFESRRFLPETSSETGWNEITIADIEKFKANNGDSNRFFFNKGIGARVVGGQEAEPHRSVQNGSYYMIHSLLIMEFDIFSTYILVGHGNCSSHSTNGIVELL